MTITMTIVLGLLGVTTTLFGSALGTRARESRKADALVSARAAISAISREIANAGYGMKFVDTSDPKNNKSSSNGIIVGDSNANRIRFRANISNSNGNTCEPGEDVTYFFDSATSSIVRYERFSGVLDPLADSCDPANNPPSTSVVVNRISNITFTYFNYIKGNSQPTQTTVPTQDTGRVRINVTVQLEEVQGQPKNQTITFTSDVTLRNSSYMLQQY